MKRKFSNRVVNNKHKKDETLKFSNTQINNLLRLEN